MGVLLLVSFSRMMQVGWLTLGWLLTSVSLTSRLDVAISDRNSRKNGCSMQDLLDSERRADFVCFLRGDAL